MKINLATLEQDKALVNDALTNAKPIDYYALKRVLLTELAFDGVFVENKICGFSKKQIHDMVSRPECYGKQIVKLSQYMCLKSGYYRRLAKYFSTMAKYRWTVDTEICSSNFEKENSKSFKRKFYKFVSQVNELKLEYELERILFTIFVNDACFGYLVKTDCSSFIYYLRPECCEIKTIVEGLYGFAINVSMFRNKEVNTLPDGLRQLVIDAKEKHQKQVMVPYDRSVCFKYNEHFTYLYPPLFQLIGDILDIDDYKDLYKAKTEQDCYRMISLKIPTTEDGRLALEENIITPFTQMAKEIVPETIGVVPSPMDLNAIQFKSDQAERDKVEDATAQLYAEAGVPQALMAGATSGSELSIAITADAGDIFRFYRQIERFVNLQMRIREVAISENYMFVFSMLDITIFNEQEVIDRELKLSQASVPNKMRLTAAAGICPAKLLGNTFVENSVLNLADSWTVLKTSATQSNNDSDKGGRPEKDENQLSTSGERTRENDTNNPDNRI